MLRPKAVSAYISDQSIVGDDMIEQIEQMMDENGDVADMRDTIYKYATECMLITVDSEIFARILFSRIASKDILVM